MATQQTFEKNLAQGRKAEEFMSRFFRERGCGTIESYNYTGSDNNKAPKLFFKDFKLVIPDLDCCKSGKRFWCEVKWKSTNDHSKKYDQPQHGIDLRLYNDYLKVEKETGEEVWICFVEGDTSDIYFAKLNSLKSYPCLCQGCKTQTKCRANKGRPPLIYFMRRDMKLIGKYNE